ncbi:hypothetical protein F4823DRAFT_635364 [Ustulina deusta]|nr:hypothetical protein F4823DRAFT_635364 [Ustulina deusta]
MDSFDNIQDLSVGGSKDWRMVTLFIGSERRAFQVHLQRLGPLVARFEQKPEGEIHMPQWDADVFNLVVNWAYNTSLPRIGNLTKWFDPNRPHPDLSLPNTDQFIPFVKSGDTDGAVDHYATITTQPRYQRFSIEELRLHFAEIQNSGDEIIRHPSNHSESEQARSEDGKAEEYHCTPSRLTIPCCIPDEEAAKAERGQILLLKLAIFSETHKWEPLFNDAMDAFRYGEAQLCRLYAPTLHIDLAFADSQTSKTVQRFILDYATALGYKHNSMSKYRDLLLSHPEFLSLMLSGMDSRTLVCFGHGRRQISNNFDVKVSYHIHNGRFVMHCKCRAMGGSFAWAGCSGARFLNQKPQ